MGLVFTEVDNLGLGLDHSRLELGLQGKSPYILKKVILGFNVKIVILVKRSYMSAYLWADVV